MHHDIQNPLFLNLIQNKIEFFNLNEKIQKRYYAVLLNKSKKLLGHLNEISVVDFDHTDVVRHPLVSKIVKAYSDQKTE